MRRSDEEGFSIVELMVVVLVIAILLAVAVPSYLRSQKSAADRAAQSDLRNAVSAAKLIAAESSPDLFQIDGVDVTPADLEAAEPALDYVDIAAADERNIGVAVSSGGELITLLKQSASGGWFAVSADARGAITFCRGDGAAACDDASADGFAASAW